MRRILLFFALLNGCAVGIAAEVATPGRVVSLDYCADQFVLKLLPRDRILAVSHDATKDFSYMREHATGLPKVRSVAEDVLTIKPDLIVRSYGGGPHAVTFFERSGIAVLQVPFANDIEGIRQTIRFVASGLGVAPVGEEVVNTMDQRLAALSTSPAKNNALYMTPTGVTSGSGTLVHEMLVAAGFENFQAEPGWRSLPLERLAYEQPDVVAAAFFDADTNHPGLWSPMRHPVAKRQMRDQPTVMLQGSWTSCGAWFLLDAIEALAATQAGSNAR